MQNIIHSAAFLSFLAITLTCSWAFGQEPSLTEMQLGTVSYQHEQYQDAIDHFGGAIPHEFANPKLHYYMGNSLVFLHQKESAIREYRIGYALDPNGAVGNLCKICLKKFGIDAAGEITRKKDKKAIVEAAKKQTKDIDAITAAAQTPKRVTFRETLDKSPPGLSVPRIHLPPKELPDATTILTEWGTTEKASYLQQALDRKERALQALDAAKVILTSAESFASSFVPNARSYGESEEQFRQRVAEGRSKMEAALAPYRKDVEEVTKTVKMETALYDGCHFALRGY